MKLLIGLALIASTSFAEVIQTVNGPRQTGYLGIDPNSPAPKYRKPILDGQEIPESFDWYDHVEAPSIKDQGQCGSCVDMSVTRALEYALAIHQGNPGLDLSEQEVLSCSKIGYGCGGSYLQAASYAVTHGQGLEKDFLYAARNLKCKKIPSIAKAKSYVLIGEKGRSPTVDEIKSALLSYGPLFATVAAGGNGWSGATGEITGCKNRNVNHAIVISAYDKNGFIIDNSWSRSWGIKGRSHIGFNCDHIGSEAGYYIVDAVE